MEEKKAKHVNLEKKRGLFLQIGYIITLAVILMAFEWTTEKDKSHIPVLIGDVEIPEDVRNTFREKEEIVERPKPKVNLTEIIDIIDDEIDLPDDDLEIDTEIDPNAAFDMTMDLPDEVGEKTIFIAVEDMPIFRPKINKTREAGDLDLHHYVGSKAEYPELARDAGIEGKVYVSFVVDEKGKVRNVHVQRKTDPLLDNEAIRVVKSIPDFKPGMQLGKAVNVSYHVAINFKLG